MENNQDDLKQRESSLLLLRSEIQKDISQLKESLELKQRELHQTDGRILEVRRILESK